MGKTMEKPVKIFPGKAITIGFSWGWTAQRHGKIASGNPLFFEEQKKIGIGFKYLQIG